MKILTQNVYLGPNHYALFPVIRLTVDLGELEQWPTGRLGEAFVEPLLGALPGLHQHGCSYGVPGGFVRRLREGEGTWLGHVFEHVAIELQNEAGADVTFGKTRENGIEGQYDVIYQYEQEDVGVEAARVALEFIHRLLPVDLRPDAARDVAEYSFAEARDAFIRFAQRRALGPSTASLVRAAEERDVPWLRLNRYSLIQLGHGKYQKRVQATVTSETRHIAVEIASDKEETNRILRDLGLPVPEQRLVYDAEEAVRAAERIGYPVVIKPLNANHGRGVTIGVVTGDEAAAAFAQAREHASTVVVEKFVTGFDHRLLVIDGALIAASKRVPGHVVGDGVRTVGELVDVTNEDPRRGIGHEKVLTRLEFDHQAERLLAKRGYAKDSVPAAGEIVYLRSTGNLSTGGTAVDVTDIVHPDNREMAIRAARAIGLDVAGVDFLCDDISRSYAESGGAICEVNAAPGFRMHVSPSEGTPRDAAGPVMDMLFPPGSPSRIPIAAVTGTNGKTTTARMIAHIAKMSGHTVGLATTDGVYIDAKLTVAGDMTGPQAARMILRDPTIDLAVLETARGGLLRAGMGYKRCDVGAVLNVQADHLGLKGIDTLQQLAKVKRVVVEVAKDAAVLNADDAECLKMAEHTNASTLIYVTLDHRHALVREHIRAGGKALVLEEGMNGQMITLYDGPTHLPLLWTHLIPATMEGRALHNVQNAMFAAAVAHALGFKADDIRHGLRTFDTSYFQAPGRLNVFNEHPFRVILDYGHNPAAVQAMVDLVERLEPKGRRIVVLAAPGDRRDEDIRAIARLCAGHFDHFICRRDDNPRGRGEDEVPRMMAEAVLAAAAEAAAGAGTGPGRRRAVTADDVEIVVDEAEAVERALTMARRDDLVLVFGDKINRCWKQIIYFRPHGDGESTAGGAMAAGARGGEGAADGVGSLAAAVAGTAGAGPGAVMPPRPAAGPESWVRDERGVRVAAEDEVEEAD
ncbi:MAG: cyanophycin synthetase [Anaerolineae bacterium]